MGRVTVWYGKARPSATNAARADTEQTQLKATAHTRTQNHTKHGRTALGNSPRMFTTMPTLTALVGVPPQQDPLSSSNSDKAYVFGPAS